MTRKKLVILIMILGISLSFSCTRLISSLFQPDHTTGIIDADNEYIQYGGRYDNSDPKNVIFDWPGFYIQAKFEGTSCSIRLVDGRNYYDVSIDGQKAQVIKTDTSKVYSVATGLSDEIHTIWIGKRTETYVGKGKFLGFILDKDKSLVEPEPVSEKRIEFIGNSITSGYGVEGKSASEHFKNETENGNLSYAALTGRALDAEYAMISYSGKGVVRNYGDANKTSANPMPTLYDRTVCSDAASVWDFSKWVPQAVVINLGTNDFSTTPHPDKDVFINAYKDLINRVQTNYGDVSIFCICGPMIGGDCATYIEELVGQCQQDLENKKVYYIRADGFMTSSDWGSDWHPNITGQQKIANVVVPVIQEKMNW